MRPVTTLFMLMSVDGKISTGCTDEMDVDRDLPKIEGVKEGLHQYYEIEQTTELSDSQVVSVCFFMMDLTTEDGYVTEELPAVGDAKIRTGY
jgi:hypothetical protein